MNQQVMPPSDVRTRFDIPRNSSFLPLGCAGGFSGAAFWQVETIEETYCLRRYPLEYPDREKLEWIHRVMVHAAANGCPQVETLLPTTDGATFTSCEGHLWQLSRWMPGEANFSESPSPERLENAITTLAKFHLGAAQVSLDFRASPAVSTRLKMLGEFSESLASIQESPTKSLSQPLTNLRQWLLSNASPVATQLQTALLQFENTILPIQPVIKDVWHDHIFYTGDDVTAIVDFGAMAMDTVCLDLARLIGSLVGNESSDWDSALETYSQIRALTKPEREIVKLLDKTGTLLGALNWMNWIYVEQRQFEDMLAVEKRVEHLLIRLAEDPSSTV